MLSDTNFIIAGSSQIQYQITSIAIYIERRSFSPLSFDAYRHDVFHGQGK
jgi:hypothetical protein